MGENKKSSAPQVLTPETLENVSTFHGFSVQHFRPMPDGHPCYTLVGQIAAEAARIERVLDNMIARLANMDNKTAACLTSQFSGTNPRFDALRKLVLLRGWTEFDKPLKKMKTEVQKDMVPRNAAVHDAWFIDADTQEPHQQKTMRKVGEYGHMAISEAELKATIVVLHRRLGSVNALLNRIAEKVKT